MGNHMRAFSALALAFVAGLFFYASAELPLTGDPSSPASVHVSPRYIEEGYRETGTINLVTAVLADYRGYDTLGETVVIFTAGMAAILILTATGLRRGAEPIGERMSPTGATREPTARGTEPTARADDGEEEPS